MFLLISLFQIENILIWFLLEGCRLIGEDVLKHGLACWHLRALLVRIGCHGPNPSLCRSGYPSEAPSISHAHLHGDSESTIWDGHALHHDPPHDLPLLFDYFLYKSCTPNKPKLV